MFLIWSVNRGGLFRVFRLTQSRRHFEAPLCHQSWLDTNGSESAHACGLRLNDRVPQGRLKQQACPRVATIPGFLVDQKLCELCHVHHWTGTIAESAPDLKIFCGFRHVQEFPATKPSESCAVADDCLADFSFFEFLFPSRGIFVASTR